MLVKNPCFLYWGVVLVPVQGTPDPMSHGVAKKKKKAEKVSNNKQT